MANGRFKVEGWFGTALKIVALLLVLVPAAGSIFVLYHRVTKLEERDTAAIETRLQAQLSRQWEKLNSIEQTRDEFLTWREHVDQIITTQAQQEWGWVKETVRSNKDAIRELERKVWRTYNSEPSPRINRIPPP